MRYLVAIDLDLHVAITAVLSETCGSEMQTDERDVRVVHGLKFLFDADDEGSVLL